MSVGAGTSMVRNATSVAEEPGAFGIHLRLSGFLQVLAALRHHPVVGIISHGSLPVQVVRSISSLLRLMVTDMKWIAALAPSAEAAADLISHFRRISPVRVATSRCGS